MQSIASLLVAAAGLAGTGLAAPLPPAPVAPVNAAVCETGELSVYFQPGADTLTPQASETISAFAESLGDCAVTHVTTNAVEIEGSRLATNRQYVVLAALDAAGIPTNPFNSVGEGETIPLRTGDANLPNGRKVTVTLTTASPSTLG